MAQPQVTLNDLAAKITDLTQQFSKVLADDGVQQPTFAPDSPVSYDGLTAESFTLRQKLTDAINDLWFLTQGPSESIFNYCHNVRRRGMADRDRRDECLTRLSRLCRIKQP